MALDRADDAAVFLSNLPAGPSERRFALAVVLASTLLFLSLAPFAKVQLPVLPPFMVHTWAIFTTAGSPELLCFHR